MSVSGTPSVNSDPAATDDLSSDQSASGPTDDQMETVWNLALQNSISLAEDAVEQAREAEKDDEEFTS